MLAPCRRLTNPARCARWRPWHGCRGDATAELTTAEMPFEESAGRLRKLLQTELLLHTDLQDRPERYRAPLATCMPHATPHARARLTREPKHSLCIARIARIAAAPTLRARQP